MKAGHDHEITPIDINAIRSKGMVTVTLYPDTRV